MNDNALDRMRAKVDLQLEKPHVDVLEKMRSKVDAQLVESQPKAEGFGAMVTGEGRREEGIGEFEIPFELATRQAKTALGLMTSFDPKRQLRIIRENYPDIKVDKDKYGNPVLDATMYGGTKGYINAPGVSFRDLTQLGFQAGAFTPAGTVARGAGLMGRMAATGAASGGIQAGLDVASQSLGGTEEVSPFNVKPLDVGIATAGGAVAEGIATLSRPIVDALRATFSRSRPQTVEAAREAARKAGITEPLTDTQISDVLQQVQSRVPPENAAAAADQARYGITYSRGQGMRPGAAQDKALATEDMLRGSTTNPAAHRRMMELQSQQERQALGAVRSEADRLTGGRRVDAMVDSGEQVRRGIESRASSARQGIDEAYGAVDPNATVDPSGAKEMLRTVMRATTKMDTSPGTVTSEVQNRVRRLIAVQSKLAERGRVSPVEVQKFEEFRRWLGRKYSKASEPFDRRQLAQLKTEFDNALPDVVEQYLMSGDPGVVEALKTARGLNRDYMRTFMPREIRAPKGRRNIPDVAGKRIEQLLSGEPSDEQVARWIFGVRELSAGKDASKIAGRMREIVGPDSDEWQSIRQSGFLHLFAPDKNGRVSAEAVMTKLQKATQGDQRALMHELYTPAEVNEMMRLAGAIRRAQPRLRNPSGTAYVMSEELQRIGASRALGALSDSLGLGGAGTIIAETAGRSVPKSIGGIMAAFKARKAVRGIRPRAMTAPAIAPPLALSASNAE